MDNEKYNFANICNETNETQRIKVLKQNKIK